MSYLHNGLSSAYLRLLAQKCVILNTCPELTGVIIWLRLEHKECIAQFNTIGLIQADTILIFLLLWTTFSSITKFTQSQVCLGWNWFLSKYFINIRFKVQHWVELHYCYGSRGMGFSGLLSLCSDSLPSSGGSSPLPVLICINIYFFKAGCVLNEPYFCKGGK